MFGKRIDKPGGGRKAVRDDMMIPAAVMTVTDTVKVDLLDVSRTGAKLRGDNLPSPGQEVMVLLGKLEAFGRVVWRDENQCGVHFDIALSELALALIEAERDPLVSRRSGEVSLAAVDWHSGLAR